MTYNSLFFLTIYIIEYPYCLNTYNIDIAEKFTDSIVISYFGWDGVQFHVNEWALQTPCVNAQWSQLEKQYFYIVLIMFSIRNVICELAQGSYWLWKTGKLFYMDKLWKSPGIFLEPKSHGVLWKIIFFNVLPLCFFLWKCTKKNAVVSSRDHILVNCSTLPRYYKYIIYVWSVIISGHLKNSPTYN